ETRGTSHRASRVEKGGRAETFGIIGFISGERAGEDAGSSPWAAELGRAAMGNMFGATIDDAMGSAGLGLSGGGEGGGGTGEGVALAGPGTSAGFGTCGAGCAGSSFGRLDGRHVVRAPVLRCPEDGCMSQIVGRLPPESVRRVVRASFGRFRG